MPLFNLMLHPGRQLISKEVGRFELDLRTGGQEFFLRGDAEGGVLGAETPGRDDHIAYRLDGQFWQVHRKINGHEEWRLTPELALAEIDSLLANNLRPVDVSSLMEPEVIVISLGRLDALSKVPRLLVDLLMPLVARLVGSIRRSKEATYERVEFAVDARRIRHLRSTIGPPLEMMGKVLQRLPPKIPASVLKRIGRWVRVHPKSIGDLKHGVYFVCTNDDAGVAWLSQSDALQYIPGSILIQTYERAGRNLPFGMPNFVSSEGGFRITGKVWTSASSEQNRPNHDVGRLRSSNSTPFVKRGSFQGSPARIRT